MKNLLILFLCIFSYKLVHNLSCLIRVRYYDKKYSWYLSDSSVRFSENTDAIVYLFKSAGIADRLIPFTQPSGYGYLAQGNASLFQNIGNLREDTVIMMFECFSQAKGTFRHRIVEAFSPIYWIDCVIYLPRKIFEYLGLKEDSIVSKIFQLLYWIATPFLILFRDNFYQYILSFFG